MFHMRPFFSVYLSWVGFGRVTSHGAENKSLAGLGTRRMERCLPGEGTHPPRHEDLDAQMELRSSLHGFIARTQ